jgi:hypothetical protein
MLRLSLMYEPAVGEVPDILERSEDAGETWMGGTNAFDGCIFP